LKENLKLRGYREKRDFNGSPEPAGGEDVEIEGEGVFVVQEHHATRLHYDLRLEIGGVLRSWAVPKEPPVEAGVKRLAVPTEDHPLEYVDFEGEIPEGHYGAGTVKIWDRGALKIEELEEGKILFELRGDRLKGRYALIKSRFRGKEGWLFFKRKK